MSCPDHGDDVACDREGKTTDGEGFPHRLELKKGQRGALHCAGCDRLIYKEELHWLLLLGAKTRPLCWDCGQNADLG